VIGSDFGRFGDTPFWDVVDELDSRNVKRRFRLAQLHTWRNSVAHQSFSWSKEELKIIQKTKGTLRDVRLWREACDALAVQLDRAVVAQATRLIGIAPW
jgi:hypothetical protein